MPLSPRTNRRRDVGKPLGAQAPEGGTRPRRRGGTGDIDTIRPAPSGGGGSAETPLVQRSDRFPDSHEEPGDRAAEGPHTGDPFGRQVSAAERASGPEGAPGVRGQVVRIGTSTDGWGDRGGAPVPPGTEAGSGHWMRETIPPWWPEGTPVHGWPPFGADTVGCRGQVIRVASEPRGVELEQSSEATRGFVPFSAPIGGRQVRPQSTVSPGPTSVVCLAGSDLSRP